jgi:hypothetical protein
MVLDLPTEQVPLRTDDHGVVRVGGTRVTLDTVIAAFENGAMSASRRGYECLASFRSLMVWASAVSSKTCC